MKNAHLIRLWLESLNIEIGVAKNTLLAYESDMENLGDFLKPTNLLEAKPHHIGEFLLHLTKAGFSSASQARKLSCLRQFFRFLYQEQIRQDDPTQLLESPKPARPLPKILSEKEIEQLLERAKIEAMQVNDKKAKISPVKIFKAVRMYVLLELLYATGLRVSELLCLPIEDGYLKTECLIVKGKGNKERLVPIGNKAKQALIPYMQLLAKKQKSIWLFPSNGKSGHLTRQHFARELKSLAGRAGLVANKISPHVLRHAFASHLLQNGADLRILQQLLGHADISTTQIYTHVLGDKLHELVLQHPLAEK